jgi:hypothetical protein
MPKIPYFDFSDGLYTSVSVIRQPETSCRVMNNVNSAHQIGAILKDTGYSRVSTQIQANKSILGLHNFRQNASTQKMLATVDDATSDDTQLFYKTSAGAWTEIGAAETAWANTAGINVEMEDFIGYCFFVGYGATDGFLPVGSLTGTTFSTATNVTSMPQAKYPKRYRDRLYIANCYTGATAYPFRVYFSSIPVAGAITWTVASDFLDVDYSEEITGLASFQDRLFVFTEYATYMYDQTQWKKVWDIGCSNHRTIKTYGKYMVWANSDGVWISTGGYPQNIAGPVIDFIRSGTPTNFFGELIDEEYWLYVGNVTVNGISYGNCAIIFSFVANQWRSREFYHQISIFARYNSSGTNRLYMGATTGDVWDKCKYTDTTLINTDAYTTTGQPIGSNFELAPIHLGNFSLKKQILKMNVLAERGQGLKLKARIIDKNTRALTPYKPIGELTKYINKFELPLQDEGVVLQIAGSEYGSNPYFSFMGFELEIDPVSET